VEGIDRPGAGAAARRKVVEPAALDGAVLMTGDRGLATAARAALGDERVRQVA
jgi:hypothetical protein